MLAVVLAALTWLPRLEANIELAHDLAVEPDIRGSVQLDVDLTLVRGEAWALEAFSGVKTWIRENEPPEGPVRISPRQVHFPVGVRLHFGPPASGWGLFVSHQSNHDVDIRIDREGVASTFAQHRETVSYEIYGAHWRRARLRLWAGLMYDRGTRLDGTPQRLPFDYYLVGAGARGRWTLFENLYGAARVDLIGHRNRDHDIPYLNVAGHIELGVAFRGEVAEWRLFFRAQRLEDYRYLGDAPRHMVLFGTALGNLP